MPDDRDVLVRKTPPAGVRAQTSPPEHVDEDYTGQHALGLITAEQLEERRTRRPTDEQVARLRAEHNALKETVTETRVVVGRIEGRLDGQDSVLDEIRRAVHRGEDRDHVVFTASVDVDTAKKHAEIEKDKAKAIAEVRAEIKDKADAKAARRKLFLKIFGGGAAAALVVTVHKLVQLWWGWL